jgi:thermitase
MRKLVLFVFIFLLLPFSVFAQENSPPPSFSKDRLLVKFRPSIPLEERLKSHRNFRSNLLKRIEDLDVDVVDVRGKDIQEVIRDYTRDPRVVFAEPDYVATVMETTNDPNLPLQWAMGKIQASGSSTTAWDITKSNANIKIAILDTGIDQDHEDLKNKVVINYKCADSSPTVDDLYGHGTHVAGIAAAATNNGIGVAGLGYNASLMNVKVLDDGGSGYYSWIANCITWAADNGAKVINMSLGGPSKSKTLENAINYAWKKGVVLVGAAGNSGNSSPTYPGYYTNVIAVAATDKNDQKASWSSYGRWVDVAAPGVDIYSTFPNHSYTLNKGSGYGYGSGTSMATPHVAGLAALVWSTSYGTSNSSVRKRIETYADKIPGTGSDWFYGRINALNSVTTPLTPTSSPTPTLTATPTPTPESLTVKPSPTRIPWWCVRFPSRCS